VLGEIKSVNGEVAEVVSKHKDLSSVFPFSLSQLQKHFRIGDHVKVIAGKFKGETGNIRTIFYSTHFTCFSLTPTFFDS
jgi:transcription elongation factor SPT5